MKMIRCCSENGKQLSGILFSASCRSTLASFGWCYTLP